MEIPTEEAEISMPVPLNSNYAGHHHMIHHLVGEPPQLDDGASHVVVPFKKPPATKYKECLKNHAASMGGNATDGCGEFMPGGEEGTLEALSCSACGCHRNFHRKQTEGEPDQRRKMFLGHHGYHHHHGHISATASRAHQYHPMMLPYGNMGTAPLPSESDELDGGGRRAGNPAAKKRFRTKFSQEQKEKMLSFAERVGWKIQKQEESVVQEFCQEVGVKRRVLKVWMHNNKHNLANKMNLQHQQQYHNSSDQNHQI